MWHWCVLLLHVQVLPASCEFLYLAVNGFNVDYFMVVLKIWIFIYCIIFAPIQKRFLYFLGNIAIFAFFLCWSWIFVFFFVFLWFFRNIDIVLPYLSDDTSTDPAGDPPRSPFKLKSSSRLGRKDSDAKTSKKIGHRRVTDQGTVTYKKVLTCFGPSEYYLRFAVLLIPCSSAQTAWCHIS